MPAGLVLQQGRQMSLTWFPFNAHAYTGDTSHLTCEEHGAYLLLMLAYYRSEKPLPARDRQLAAVCKLSLDAWLEAKLTLAPFFREQDGFWFHDVIEETIKTQNLKMVEANERAKTGASKRWAGHIPKSKSKKNADAMPDALPLDNRQQCPSNADLDLDKEQLSLSAHTRDEKLEPEESEDHVGSPIDPTWRPMPEWVIEATEIGYSAEEVENQRLVFIASKQETGSFSANWDSSWVVWWDRYRSYKQKQASKAAKPRAAPRIEMDTVFVPTEKNFEKACEMFAKGMRWPRGHGGEPGDVACRCPPEIMIKYGIDPKTGIKHS